MLQSNTKIQIICLPPNTTHILQPLDISFFKSFKVKHCVRSTMSEAYAREHQGTFVNKKQQLMFVCFYS